MASCKVIDGILFPAKSVTVSNFDASNLILFGGAAIERLRNVLAWDFFNCGDVQIQASSGKIWFYSDPVVSEDESGKRSIYPVCGAVELRPDDRVLLTVHVTEYGSWRRKEAICEAMWQGLRPYLVATRMRQTHEHPCATMFFRFKFSQL